jgi:hypothetical protein
VGLPLILATSIIDVVFVELFRKKVNMRLEKINIPLKLLNITP